MITAKVLLITTLTEHYYHDGVSAKNPKRKTENVTSTIDRKKFLLYA